MSTLQAPTARRDEILTEVARRLGDSEHPDRLREEIEAFCRKWRITEFCLFGSVLRDDFRPDSDVDVVVSFCPTARHSLLAVVRMERELGVTLGRRADLVIRRSVEESDNPFRRNEVLRTLECVYVA